MRTPQLIFPVFILPLTACNSVSQSKFWTEYRANEIAVSEAHQNDNGGRRTVHWETKSATPFPVNEVLGIASKNGWTLVDTQRVRRDELKSWIISDTLIFPLYFDGTYKMWTNDDPRSWTAFVRYIGTDMTVYRFKTKERLTFLGSHDWTNENGYVLLSDNERQLTVYHHWDK